VERVLLPSAPEDSRTVRSTLNPLAALAAALLVAVVLCAVFLALLAGSLAPRPSTILTLGLTHHEGMWMAGFAPCAALLALVGAGALTGALFRSERRVGPAVRVSTRVRPRPTFHSRASHGGLRAAAATEGPPAVGTSPMILATAPPRSPISPSLPTS
jgi:hypothetical protein